MMTESDFEDLVVPLRASLYGAAMKLSQNPAEAEDLVQDTLVRAFRFWESFEQGTNIKSWLFTILRNTFINGYHRRGRKLSFESDVSAQVRTIGPAVAVGNSASQPPGPDTVDAEADKTAVHRALEQLPHDQRRAVTLCDLEGFSYKEIAADMSCPIGTVMSRIYRGRKQLHRLLYEHARAIGLVEDGAGIDRGEDRSAW